MTHSWHRTVVILAAIPVFLFLPVGITMLVMTGKQLVFGFDDMPMGAMIFGFVFGLIVAVSTLGFFCYGVRRGTLRIPLIIIVIAAGVDLAAVPVARWLTHRVEHPTSRLTPPHSDIIPM